MQAARKYYSEENRCLSLHQKYFALTLSQEGSKWCNPHLSCIEQHPPLTDLKERQFVGGSLGEHEVAGLLNDQTRIWAETRSPSENRKQEQSGEGDSNQMDKA